MSPALIAVLVQLIQVAVEETPQLIADLEAIFSKPNPTPADWEALRSKVLSVSYADYVPASALPSGGGDAPLPAVSTPTEPQTPAVEAPGATAEAENPIPNQNAAGMTPATTVPVGVKP